MINTTEIFDSHVPQNVVEHPTMMLTGGKTVKILQSFFTKQVKLPQTLLGHKIQGSGYSFSQEDNLMHTNVYVIDYRALFICKMHFL